MPLKYYPAMKMLRNWLTKRGFTSLANRAHYAYLQNKMSSEHVTLEQFLDLMRKIDGAQEVYSHGTYIFNVPTGMKVIIVPDTATNMYAVTFKGHSVDYLTPEERKALDE